MSAYIIVLSTIFDLLNPISQPTISPMSRSTLNNTVISNVNFTFNMLPVD